MTYTNPAGILLHKLLRESNFNWIFCIVNVNLRVEIADRKMSFFLELKFEEGLACILLIIFHEMKLFDLTKIFKNVSDILLNKTKKKLL